VPLIESEATLIARLRELFNTSFQSGVELGIGDDAAVLSASNNKLVATVDMAVEGVTSGVIGHHHFKLAQS